MHDTIIRNGGAPPDMIRLELSTTPLRRDMSLAWKFIDDLPASQY